MEIEKKLGKQQLLIIRNILECEAHRELFLRGVIRKENE